MAVPLSPLTITCVGLLALAMFLSRGEAPQRRAGRLLAMTLAAIGAVVVAQFLSHFELPLGHLDLAPVSGVQLVPLGLAIALDGVEGARERRVVELSALLSLAISILLVLGRDSTESIALAVLFSL